MPTADADPEAERRALANVLMPAWLYREQRYSLPDHPRPQ
jgi:hypothetical protein